MNPARVRPILLMVVDIEGSGISIAGRQALGKAPQAIYAIARVCVGVMQGFCRDPLEVSDVSRSLRPRNIKVCKSSTPPTVILSEAKDLWTFAGGTKMQRSFASLRTTMSSCYSG